MRFHRALTVPTNRAGLPCCCAQPSNSTSWSSLREPANRDLRRQGLGFVKFSGQEARMIELGDFTLEQLAPVLDDVLGSVRTT